MINKQLKRFMVVLLPLFLFLLSYPIISYAEEEEEVIVVSEGDLASVHWCLYSDGLLSITGEGHLENSFVSRVMYSGRERIVKLEIADGITSIGDSAFSNLPSLSEVSIGDTVTEIGNTSFAFCGNLKNVKFEGTTVKFETQTVYLYENEGYTKPWFGSAAFEACTSLEEITAISSSPEPDLATRVLSLTALVR